MITINMYLGYWIDDNDKALIIKKDDNEIKVDLLYKNKDVDRQLLNGAIASTTNMKTYICGDELIVELGTEGRDPILKLELIEKDGKEHLIPALEHGLYDDRQEDFGVPWFFPLSYYVKAERKKHGKCRSMHLI